MRLIHQSGYPSEFRLFHILFLQQSFIKFVIPTFVKNILNEGLQ